MVSERHLSAGDAARLMTLTAAAEADAFHFEAGALLERGFVEQLDRAAGADHALPGKRAAGARELSAR